MTLVNGIAPDYGFKLEEGIFNGQDKRQQLDIYYPEVKQPRRPVIVFFNVGSWLRGDRQKYHFVGQAHCFLPLKRLFRNRVKLTGKETRCRFAGLLKPEWSSAEDDYFQEWSYLDK